MDDKIIEVKRLLYFYKEVIKKDEKLSFYIYEICMKNHKQLGFLALANIEDYYSNKIKGHELIPTEYIEQIVSEFESLFG